MGLASTIRAMVDAGCTPAQILAVVETAEAARDAMASEKRAKDAERQRRKRHAVSRGVTRTECDIEDAVSPSSFPLSSPPTPPPIIPQSPTPSDTHSAREADFRQSIAKIYAKHGHLTPDTGRAVIWLKQGRDAEICRAVVDDVLGRKGKLVPLSYFDGPIADAHAPPPVGEARAPPQAKSGKSGWAELYRKSNGIGEFANERGN